MALADGDWTTIPRPARELMPPIAKLERLLDQARARHRRQLDAPNPQGLIRSGPPRVALLERVLGVDGHHDSLRDAARAALLNYRRAVAEPRMEPDGHLLLMAGRYYRMAGDLDEAAPLFAEAMEVKLDRYHRYGKDAEGYVLVGAALLAGHEHELDIGPLAEIAPIYAHTLAVSEQLYAGAVDCEHVLAARNQWATMAEGRVDDTNDIYWDLVEMHCRVLEAYC